MTKRSSLEIWRTLNKELSTIVRSYHHSVVRLPDAIEDLIDGTAFFPGGSGLWRGEKPFGSLPEIFPEHSLLFVGHNFDSVRAFQRTRLRGGEGSTPFWKTLRSILNGAGVPPEQCFFTNALMGLQPGKSTGAMPSTPDYLRQCNLFLTQQIRIVRPRAVISLGKPAYARLLLVNPSQLSFRWHIPLR